MTLDHEIRCPCGVLLMTIHAGDATPIRVAAARVARAKLARALKQHGKKPPRGKDLGKIRARSAPTAEDLAPELAAFWQRHHAQEKRNPTRHYCTCGAVVEHQPGPTQGAPRGKAVGTHGRGREASVRP